MSNGTGLGGHGHSIFRHDDRAGRRNLCDTSKPNSVPESVPLTDMAVPPRARVPLVRRYAPTLLAAAVLVPHALYFNFVNDDAYISFRYARNLAEHGQLVFNLGERVEGFTNFLWTVLLALGLKVGVAPELSSRVMGTVCGALGLAVVNRISLRLDGERPAPGHFVAPLGLAATSAYACWCMGGLETQLFTLLFLLGADRFLYEIGDPTRGARSAMWFALAGMTRPEGLLLFGLAGAFRLARMLGVERRVVPRAQEWRWVALFVAVFGPYFAWRWWYFGWPFPNTFYVKSSGGAGAWPWGLYYLRRFSEDHMAYVLVPLALAGWPARSEPERRRLFSFAVLVIAAFAVYTAKVGGDFMGLYRFVLPVIPLGALLLQESLRALGARLSALVSPLVRHGALAGIMFGYALGNAKVSYHGMTIIGADRGIDSPGYLQHYVEERIPVGLWFAQHARPDDLMTVGGAGVIPYLSGIAAYDVFGLVDERIAHDPSMTVSQRPGHQKWGSDAYMVSRNPTLITHHYRLHAAANDNADYWRQLGYEWVTATIPGLSSPPLYSFLKRIDRSFGPFPANARTSAPAP